MPFHKFNFRTQTSFKKWFFSTVILSVFTLISSSVAYAEKKTRNKLPSSPDTGSPEEDFSAGGTRDNHLSTGVCGADGQPIIYLLGDNNREFTIKTHPTFWFYFSERKNKISQIKFILTELETGKQIYSRTVEAPEKVGTVGITIPAEQKSALFPNINYSWSINVNCVGQNESIALAQRLAEGEIATLEGWIHRLPLNADLQNQLANASTEEKYRVYLQNNLLYDALDYLAQRRITEPNNSQLKVVWNQLLSELGWQNLIEPVVKPRILNVDIVQTKTR